MVRVYFKDGSHSDPLPLYEDDRGYYVRRFVGKKTHNVRIALRGWLKRWEEL